MAAAVALRVDAPRALSSRRDVTGGSESQLTVSVIVCAYTMDRWADVRRAVASVRSQRRPAQEIILVVDHCEELEGAARRHLAGVTVVANVYERGLSGARNTGIEIATGDVVAFLDDDAAASPDWLSHLTAPYRDHRVVGVGGRIDPRWIEGRPSWFPPEFDWVVGCTYRGMPQSAAPVRNLIGANMSFRRATFELVGGFRAGLGRVGTAPVGCEETELCLRVASGRGAKRLVYEPAAVVWHTVPTQRATWRYFLSRCAAEGRSKAAVAGIAGAAPALASERRYVRSVLPRGFLRALADGVANPGRFRAAGAIVAGLTVTSVAYLAGPAVKATPEGEALARSPHPITPSVTALHVVALVTAAALWVVSLGGIAVDRMNDFGLVSVLPSTFWAALVLVTASFCVAASRRGAARWLLPAHVVLLLTVLHGTPAILYGTLRYAWAWKHVGVVDFILRTHNSHISGGFLVYAGWPGFFALNASLTQGSGWASALSYASWAPLAFNILDLFPLLVIVRSFTADRRHVWMAVWLYYLANWVGQDYFAPQAGALFLYLVVVALCLRWLSDPRVERRYVTRIGGKVSAIPRRTVPGRRAAHVIIFLLVLAIVSSHQLTPYMLIAALAALYLCRTRRTGLLAIGAGAMAVGWALLFGRAFLVGDASIWTSIGSLLSNTSAGLNSLSPRPSAAQAAVAQVDRMLVAAMWLLAVVGLWRRRRSWRSDLPLALLAVTPVALLAGNAYGGEMLLRVYLFGLAPLSFFAAAAFFPSPGDGRSSLTTPATALIAGLVLLGFTVAYYGKERANHFSHREVAASQWLANRPAGTLVSAVTANFPWSFRNYERFAYEWMVDETPAKRRRLLANPAAYLAERFTRAGHRDTYVVFTRSQSAEVEMSGVMPAGAPARIQRSVLASPRFVIAYRNRDAVIVRYIGGMNR